MLMYYRNRETQRRLKKIAMGSNYIAGAYFDDKKGRYIRYSCNNARTRQLYNKRTRAYLKRNLDLKLSNGAYKHLNNNYKWDLL